MPDKDLKFKKNLRQYFGHLKKIKPFIERFSHMDRILNNLNKKEIQKDN